MWSTCSGIIKLQVEKLARQFGVAEDVAYTCETAAHFWLLHVLSRWEKFLAQAKQKKTAQCVKDLFPFKAYFAGELCAPGQIRSPPQITGFQLGALLCHSHCS